MWRAGEDRAGREGGQADGHEVLDGSGKGSEGTHERWGKAQERLGATRQSRAEVRVGRASG